MSELKKLSFSWSDVRLFEWQNLWWYQDEIDIGFDALNALIDNQEKTMNESMVLTEKLKKERLSEIPEEYRSSYEQQFFENSDKVNYQLRIMQRYSSCLMILSFFEHSLKFLSLEIAEKTHQPFIVPSNSIVPNTMKFLVNEFNISPLARSKEYNLLLIQRVVRDSIAHHNGIIPDDRIVQFVSMEGINLKNNEIIIRPEYLKNLVELSKKFFKDLILLIDDRFIELSKGK